MQAHVLRGTKQQIADNLAQMPDEVCEAIVFVDEPVPAEARMPPHLEFGAYRQRGKAPARRGGV
jgi:hypothetical protein